jgi:ketosteroid isomerase-like protein
MSDIDEVTKVYLAWCTAFQSLDVAGMKSLFDHDFDGMIYQAEETADPLYSWPEISAYWDAIPAIVSAIPEWRELDKKVAVDDDSAAVYSKLRTNIEIKGAKRPLIGDLRVVLGMRKAAGDWRIVSVHESRQVDLSGLFED